MWNNQLQVGRGGDGGGARVRGSARARREHAVPWTTNVSGACATWRRDALNTRSEEEKIRHEAPQLALFDNCVPVIIHMQRRHDLERDEQRRDDA